MGLQRNTTESTNNLPVHDPGVGPTCDMDELGQLRPVYERISTPIESPAATAAWNAWHFRHGLVNISSLQP
jgi:hypothetical protein